MAEQDLTEIGKHITFTEERADDAEDELTTVLILQMLSDKIGEELDCVVTGLTNFGVFAQSRKLGIEGLIRIADLGPDEWKFNQSAHCIIGRRSGCTIRLGQPILTFIVSVNVPARQLNLAPVKPLVKPPAEKKKGITVKKSKKARRRRNPG